MGFKCPTYDVVVGTDVTLLLTSTSKLSSTSTITRAALYQCLRTYTTIYFHFNSVSTIKSAVSVRSDHRVS